MDISSGKRPVGRVSALRKGSSPFDGSRDETAQFCNRIGCSGRLKFLESPKGPSSRSSNITNVKKPAQESRKKMPSKLGIQELNTPGSNQAKMKPKSRDTESIGRTNGQKSGLAKYDAQIGMNESVRKRNTVKKRTTERETSSSANGKKISGPSSVRTRRSVNLDGNNSSSVSIRATPDEPQAEVCWLSGETSSGGSTLNAGYDVDAIANVLLALERIDQDEELTYEQILSLDGNSFLGRFNMYDQHRDMRLDIDNMSYEELLALEERMGIVSTALSEEELSKCIIISIYKPLHTKESRTRTRTSSCLDDTKCSICQEEFIAEDEIGRIMKCNHEYHAVCINQWLRLKNWCPVCKASAKPKDSQ